MTDKPESGNATHAELMAKIAELTGGKPSAETVEPPAAEPAKADEVVEKAEAGNQEEQKPLEELTPEELIAKVQELTEGLNNWKGMSRKNEDEKKKFQALVEKLENTRPPEEVIAERVAALEAKLSAAEKETAILKTIKEHNLPDTALPILNASSLENLAEVTETVVALLATVTEAGPAAAAKPALPTNPFQGKETTGQHESPEVRGLNALFDGI
jgi:hypothetical protein